MGSMVGEEAGPGMVREKEQVMRMGRQSKLGWSIDNPLRGEDFRNGLCLSASCKVVSCLSLLGSG